MQSRQPARPGNHGAREAVPLYRSHRSPREPEETSGKNGGEGKVGRLTMVGDGETLTRPDNNRRGGEDGGRDQGSAERPPGASGTLQLLRTPLPLLLLAAGFLPSSVLIRLTTSLLATRPGSARSRGRRRNRLQLLETPAARVPSMRALRACPVHPGRRDGRERYGSEHRAICGA